MDPARVSPVRMMATLGLAGMVSGAVMASAYLVTAPVIAENRAAALERAVYEVLPSAVAQRPFVLRDGGLAPYAGHGVPTEEAVFAGFDADGRFIGFAVPAAGAGFQDTISLLFGFRPADQHVLGLAVLESRETPGLGDRIGKDAAFLRQFQALDAHRDLVARKPERTPPDADRGEIDVITGATISSKAVVRIIDGGLDHWRAHLPATVAAPAPGKEGP
ncbi:MAG: FMN-binding protein [Deltaproteobacteria bacterium]|nr:MAG: FMN-binding protein [Deltaproteobacteria bacterium]